MGAPRKYPLELRERAVRLALESGRPIRQVARDLGVHHEALRVWVRQAQADSGRRCDLLTSEEREELKRLRKGCGHTDRGEHPLHRPPRRTRRRTLGRLSR